jgi:hypothetical protein
VCEAEVVAGWSFESSAAVEFRFAFSVEVEYRDCCQNRAVALALEIPCAFLIDIDVSCLRGNAWLLWYRWNPLKSCKSGWRCADGAAHRALDATVTQALLIVQDARGTRSSDKGN